ncbi:MAG: chemotaxis protein CheX [Polyangiaceae bacterium]
MMDASFVEIAEVYGAFVRPRLVGVTEPPAVGFVSRIGFVGEQVWGSLELGLSSQFVAESLPALLRQRGESSERMLSDWAGELANQVLGRFKNKLRPFSVNFELNTPVVASRAASEGFRGRSVARYSSDYGDCSVYLSLSTAPGLVLSASEQPEFDDDAVLLF